MPDLKNLLVLCVFLFLVPTMYDVIFQIVGPNTTLYNFTNTTLTANPNYPIRPEVFLPRMTFALRWGFRLIALGILIWALAGAEREEPYEQGFGGWP